MAPIKACVIVILWFVGSASLLVAAGAPDAETQVRGIAAKFCDTVRPDILLRPDAPHIKSGATNTVVFPMADGREAMVMVDPKASEVVSFSAFKGFSRKPHQAQATVDDATLEDENRRIVLKLGINTNLVKEVFSKRFKVSANSAQELVKFVWQRRQHGFAFKDDFVLLTLDASDGEVLGYRKQWGASPDSFAMQMKLNDAKVVAETALMNAGHGPNPKVAGADVFVVSPNAFLGLASPAPAGRKLAWAIEFAKQPGFDKPLEVWVDASSGVLLGGLALDQ